MAGAFDKAEWQRQARAKNPERYKAYTKKYQQWKKPDTRAYRLEYMKKRKAWRKGLLDAIKVGKGCADCGYNTHAVALQFDHVRGTKSFNIGSGVNRNWKILLAELQKCDVRCANCHSVRSWS